MIRTLMQQGGTIIDIDTAVDKVRTWYDDLLAELLSNGDLTGHPLEMQPLGG